MNHIFISNPFLGSLSIINVYIEYDGPRCFSLENETGSSFIAYWLGDEDNYEKWFVIPCSKARVIAFEKKKIDLRQLLSQQEQDYFYSLYLPFGPSEDITIVPALAKSIFSIRLPKPGIFVENIQIYSPSLTNENLLSTHELIISKSSPDSKRNVMLNQITKVCENFCDLAFGYNSSFKIKGNIQTLNARYGSFAINLHADELEKFETVFSVLAEMMINKKDILSFIVENNIDIKDLCSLFEAIYSTHVDFELKSVHLKDRVIKIYKNDALTYYKKLSRLSLEYISSIRVPQANDLNKIFIIVELLWASQIITAEVLGVDKRHVGYYKQAARLLGFVKSDGSLTTSGQRLALASSELKMRLTARAFEASDCGWAWINWSEATSLKDLDESTAEMFLTERCPRLSGTTVKRRADTLRIWHKKLMPFYEKDINEVNEPNEK